LKFSVSRLRLGERRAVRNPRSFPDTSRSWSKIDLEFFEPNEELLLEDVAFERERDQI